MQTQDRNDEALRRLTDQVNRLELQVKELREETHGLSELSQAALVQHPDGPDADATEPPAPRAPWHPPWGRRRRAGH